MKSIRIEGDTLQEVRRAIDLFRTAYDDSTDFSEPQKGGNLKYAINQKYFSYNILKGPNQIL